MPDIRIKFHMTISSCKLLDEIHCEVCIYIAISSQISLDGIGGCRRDDETTGFASQFVPLESPVEGNSMS